MLIYDMFAPAVKRRFQYRQRGFIDASAAATRGYAPINALSEPRV
jgi:hypothetical protein